MYLHISANHKILVLHRAYLSTGKGSATQRETSKQATLTAARAMLAELGKYKDLKNSVTPWQIPYHAVSAASVLALGLFQAAGGPSASPDARAEVSSAIEALRDLGSYSIIARRGVEVLSDLLQEELKWSQDQHYRRKREAEGGVEAVVKRIKMSVSVPHSVDVEL